VKDGTIKIVISMKNKDLVCKGLLVAIIILIGITVCYYLIKSDVNNTNVNDNLDINKNNKEENNHIDSSSSDITISEDDNIKGLFRRIRNYDEFSSLISRDTSAFFVFGRKGCHYCELYIPILEDLANNYKVEINYID